ncbi:hypothetical protein [Kitasatospora kifunensis]|uniref:Uncharacterized protein n=1 Tax=Kitasatospora kifunensis TaxID=58351 RepID=A0A7W7VV39_KITKI|nr:hypothetical protein [Kitasatospora kifunensis]MBB4924001.1 hypothetical protein [Kitasatospora kifunensis]
MDFEDDLTEMLVKSVDELDPPIALMIAEGSRDGRRRRRIRRGLQVAGAAVVVAALVTAGAVVGLGSSGSSHSMQAADATAASGGPSASPSASASASASLSASPSTQPATADLTWQAMLKILNDQLPPGAQLGKLDTYAVKFNDNAHTRYVELQYNDGAGASTVMVTVSNAPIPTGIRAPMTDCTNWKGGVDEGGRKPGYEHPSCQVRQLPDGTKVLGYITGTDGYGLYDESVKVFRPDGTEVSITAANATLDQYTGTPGPNLTVTRDKPPVGLPGWEAIAQSPQWQMKVPQSVVDAGVAFAKTVSRLPCPQDTKPGDCDID